MKRWNNVLINEEDTYYLGKEAFLYREALIWINFKKDRYVVSNLLYKIKFWYMIIMYSTLSIYVLYYSWNGRKNT